MKFAGDMGVGILTDQNQPIITPEEEERARLSGYPSEQNARRSSHSDDTFDADQVELCWNCYFSFAYLDRQILA